MVEDVGQALDALQGNWDNAVADPKRLEGLPLGSYLFKITNAYTGRSSTQGRLQFRIDFTVLLGPTDGTVGRNYFKTWGLDDDDGTGMKWLVGDLLNLKIAPPTAVGELSGKIAQELVNVCFEARLTAPKNKAYSNMPNVMIPTNARRTEQGSLPNEDSSERF